MSPPGFLGCFSQDYSPAALAALHQYGRPAGGGHSGGRTSTLNECPSRLGLERRLSEARSSRRRSLDNSNVYLACSIQGRDHRMAPLSFAIVPLGLRNPFGFFDPAAVTNRPQKPVGRGTRQDLEAGTSRRSPFEKRRLPFVGRLPRLDEGTRGCRIDAEPRQPRIPAGLGHGRRSSCTMVISSARQPNQSASMSRISVSLVASANNVSDE